MCIPITLQRCPELRELVLPAPHPHSMHDAVMSSVTSTISSITSTNIRKIVLSSHFLVPALHTFVDQHCWRRFDECVSALADKLCKSETLEVELRLHHLLALDPLVDPKGFLPRFREKGRVRIVYHSRGRVLLLAVRFPFLLASS